MADGIDTQGYPDKQKITVLPDGRVSRRDAAIFLGREPKTLADWNSKGIGPKSWMVGGRRFYHIDDLSAFTDTGAIQLPPEPGKHGGRPSMNGDGQQKRAPISMRTTPALRERIESAAQANGLSIAQEVERRLIASFDYQDAASYLRRELGL